jgi:hypothetical protein
MRFCASYGARFIAAAELKCIKLAHFIVSSVFAPQFCAHVNLNVHLGHQYHCIAKSGLCITFAGVGRLLKA